MELPNQELHFPFLYAKQLSLWVKREDLIHPEISGNKYRKLKYNLQEANRLGKNTLLTFGGAFSNHIAAVAYAGSAYGFNTIGVIRGEELVVRWKDNPTLQQAVKHGMQLHFVTREDYRKKEEPAFAALLRERFGDFYHLPEGGTNALAVKGCEEILREADADFDVICTCVGTGGTLAGLANSAKAHQRVLGFPVLKGHSVSDSIHNFATNANWEVIPDFHFGGYARVTEPLIRFINTFKATTGIPLDPVYTGKLFFGLFEMIKQDKFAPGQRILAVHTGGLQGIQGMNSILKRRNLPLIDL